MPTHHFTRRGSGVPMHLTANIRREGNGYVALCPQLDIASQGETVTEAHHNLTEALALFFETAADSEVERRLHGTATPP